MTTTVTDNMLATPAVAFKQAYVSSNITVSSGLILPQPHGFGVIPALARAYLLCITPEQGYSAGDNVQIPQINTTGGCMLALDGINVTVILQGLPTVPNKSTGVPATITAADWKLVLRAWV